MKFGNANISYDKAYLKALKESYYIAKAMYETTKEMAEEIECKILRENEFYETAESAEINGHTVPERIYNPKNTFEMDLDNDFQRYLDLVYPEYVKAGINDPRGKEYIPYAEEKSLCSQAEKLLIDYAISLVPNEYKKERELLKQWSTHWKYRNKILDLILSLEC